MSRESFNCIAQKYDCITHFTDFMLAFYEVLLSEAVDKLTRFIKHYQCDAYEEIAMFASGLNKDFEAVKNCLLYPHISNGPMEGTNNKIKMVRKRGFGRAGLELLNALLVLPWYYKDLDANTLDNESSVA